MVNMTANEISKAVNGTLFGNCNAIVSDVQYDSREVKEGTLFVPIKGANVDGHKFIEDCFSKGAGASFTENDVPEHSTNCYIKVENTLSALQKLSAYYRNKMKVRLIGVTGSVGKTSTKEMIAAGLSKGFDVMKTQGNKNSQIGLPMTMFDISENNDIAVIEMGMSEFGEMDRLADIARPDIAVMTNIGVAHIENLGTQENILKEKFRITKYFDKDGVLFLNGDDKLLKTLHGKQDFMTVTFGLNKDNDYYAEDIQSEGFNTKFVCCFGNNRVSMKIPALGEHSVKNALGAFAIGKYLGLDDEVIQEGLMTYKNAPMRQQIHEMKDFIIIDDSYNSSPDAAKVSLNVLKSVTKGKSIAVLADMLELGEKAESEHYGVGKHIADIGIDTLITVGELSKYTAKGAGENGCKNIFSFEDNNNAYEQLEKIIEKDCAVLVKGSRGMHTDEIVKKVLVNFENK